MRRWIADSIFNLFTSLELITFCLTSLITFTLSHCRGLRVGHSGHRCLVVSGSFASLNTINAKLQIMLQ